ncbi:Asp-tRNA(Asn)/Glu-tRNA(Gln) amidotransferase subunit GatB [Poriferisphaera sp. WC338]|uniref:Asp-tRNA(Asn)/Glu-tRNA(Gln) amidotransferase subunit GatB n=1 Tax=Poriferisphaera sp. WC338 TaxID=3425129 RepID=UPI003D81604C
MTTNTAANIKARLMVGMEIHVELATRSKMWTSAPNVAHPDYFDAEPNTLLDPVVIGMPGTLPVMNKEAVEMSMRVGLALGCEIARKCKWDRKSYYYPDLPKNYQISQYDQPLVGEGTIELPLTDDPNGPTKTIRILRAHLEEDAGKLAHEAPGGRAIDHSIVDLNRAGTPLLEIVTEPDFASADEAVRFGQVLRDICRHLGVSEGIMQKGHMRFEPNINVIIEKDGQTYKTPIVEIKNLNSFRAVHGAITHEYDRQIEEWLSTGVVMGKRAKSTRGWDDVNMVTVMQRQKEDADEYRYFPDPDLVDLIVDQDWHDRVAKSIPELPLVKLRRYRGEFGLSEKDANALVDEPATTSFYEAALALGMDPKRAATMLLNYGLKRANESSCRIDQLGITPEQLKDIDALQAGDKIGSSAADTLFGLCCDSDEAAEKLANDNGLVQVSDTGALEGFVDEVLANERNAKIVADIEGGKDAAVGALIGQIMKLSKGQANPKMIREIIIKKVRG